MSIPPEPGQTVRRPPIEPTYVMRRRRSEALAELLREMEQDRNGSDFDEGYESVPVAPAPERILPRLEEYETEELPPVLVGEDFGAGTGRRGERPGRRRLVGQGRGMSLKRAAIAVAVAAAALIGFGSALLVPGDDKDKEARTSTPPATTPTAEAPTRQAVDPDGPGTLREGDSGPEVTELQERLRRIPNVYDNGSTDGRYDATLTEAVARFQLWYGIRGDETGVYGNDTRLDLESRT